MKWWDILQETRMGFCVGVAVLMVQVPPNWDAWMQGDLRYEQIGLWMVAVAAVTRGFLWGASKLAGVPLPAKWRKKDETDRAGAATGSEPDSV